MGETSPFREFKGLKNENTIYLYMEIEKKLIKLHHKDNLHLPL